MNCNKFCERLSDFVDGELPEELKGGFATHLDGCAVCTAKLQQFRLLSQVLQAGSVDPYAHPLQVDDLYQAHSHQAHSHQAYSHQAHSHQAHAGVSAAVPLDLSADVPEDVPVERMWATIAAGLDARESASIQCDGSLPAGSSSTPVSSSSTAISSSALSAAPVEARSLDRRWHSGAMVALLAIAGMGLWFLPGLVNTSKNNAMHAGGSAASGGSGISGSSAASDKSAASAGVSSTGASSVNAVIDFQDLLTTGLQPRQALAALSQQFRGKETPPADARALLGYEPSMAQELPGGLQLVSLQVLKLPHCNCPAGKCTCGPGGCNCSVSLCERADGSDLLVVEHCESQPISFGDFPAELVRRAEQEFHFLKAGKQYAATWTANQRRLTAIGVNDLEEAALLIANNK